MKAFILAIVVGILLLPARCPAHERSDIVFADTMARVIRLISKEHFTPASEAELTNWAIHGLFETVKKPIPPKIAERLKKIGQPKAEAIGELLRDARAEAGQRKELADGRDVDICLGAISDKLEPVAPPDQRIAVEKASPFSMGGAGRGWRQSHIGLTFEFDRDTRFLRVMTATVNGPAYKAGIRPGDIVTAIRVYSTPDGEPLTEPDGKGKMLPTPKVYSMKDISTGEAEFLLRGRPGTRVTLMVIPVQQVKK